MVLLPQRFPTGYPVPPGALAWVGYVWELWIRLPFEKKMICRKTIFEIDHIVMTLVLALDQLSIPVNDHGLCLLVSTGLCRNVGIQALVDSFSAFFNRL
jgi:hypothetical protein